MSPRVVALWTIALSVMAMPEAPAWAWCQTRTVKQPSETTCGTQGAPLAWQGACVTLQVNPAITAPGIPRALLRTALEEGAAAWNNALCDRATGARATFALRVGDDTADGVGYRAAGANRNVVTWRPVWGDDRDHAWGVAAVTTVTYGPRSGVILDTDIELNARAMEGFRGDGAPGALDLRTIVAHELGHVLGLAHSADRSAVMYYRAGAGEQRRAPTVDDVAGLCTLYPPWREIACEPELRTHALEGGGLACAGGGGSDPGAVLVTALLALGWRRRRSSDDFYSAG